MNYLIQAYACSPNQGGEYAVSWGWIIHLDKFLDDTDRIYVVSLTLKQEDVENAGLKHVKLVPVKGINKYEFLHYNQLFYQIWQKKAYSTIKKIGVKIDVVHVFSLSDFRQPGKWCELNGAYSILGPVGGGQICPSALKSYDDRSGTIRGMINATCKWNLLYKHKVNKYSKIYACNEETKKYFNNAKILVDVPLNDKLRNLKIEKRENEIPKILFMGRLINKKGLLLLLDSLQYIESEIQYHIYIYGEGEQKELIKSKIVEKGLENKVFVMGKVPYEQISEVYRQSDIFVLPSLRESGGSVLIEAMAHKLPIVALRMSLSAILDKKECGLFVNVKSEKEKILKEFAYNITTLIKNSELREYYGENGYVFVNSELTWDVMMNEVYGNFIGEKELKNGML